MPTTQALEMWKPLPRGTHAVVTTPYLPQQQPDAPPPDKPETSAPSSPALSRYSTLSSDTHRTYHTHSTGGVSGNGVVEDMRVPLELGDAVHLLEVHAGGEWGRGYVFPANGESGSATATAGLKAQRVVEDEVLCGIFPLKCLWVRGGVPIELPSKSVDTPDMDAGGPKSAPLAMDDHPPELSRPAVSRTATAPSQQQAPTSPKPSHSNSAPSTPKRPTLLLRPNSFAPGTPAPRKVLHPIPAPLRPSHETAAGIREPLIDEISACLRHWSTLLDQHLRNHDYASFTHISKLFQQLYQGRKTLLSQTLGQAELIKIRKQLVKKMEEGNAYQGAELVIRHYEKGYILSERNATIMNLWRIHSQHAAKGRKRAASSGRNNEDMGVEFTNLHLDIKKLSGTYCSPTESVEFGFALYNAAESRFLTEDYSVTVSGSSLADISSGESIAGKWSTVFTSLTPRDMSPDLYLVCRVTRLGRMSAGENKTSSSQSLAEKIRDMSSSVSSLDNSVSSLDVSISSDAGYVMRRPHSWGVAAIGDLLNTREKGVVDVAMRFYVATSEALFPTLYDHVIQRMTGYEPSPRGEFALVSLRPVPEKEKEKYGSIVSPRNDFGALLRPQDKRNDLYLTLGSADFTSSGFRNVQVTVDVTDRSGRTITDCIFTSSTPVPTAWWESTVYYHNPTPKYMETFKISLPASGLLEATAIFRFRHVKSNSKTTSPFAVAYLNFRNQGSLPISDGVHSLSLYKHQEKEGSSSRGTLLKDTCSVRTRLVSAVLTQSRPIHDLLEWKSRASSELPKLISNLQTAGELEIIKFLPSLLTALFSVMDSHLGPALDAEIFRSLVFLLRIFTDKRFLALHRPVMEQWIEGMKSHRAWEVLLGGLKTAVARRDEEGLKEWRVGVRVWEWVIKLAGKSNEIASQEDGDEFVKTLTEFLTSVNGLMSTDTDKDSGQKRTNILASQSLTLQHFPSFLPSLQLYLPATQIINILATFIDSTPDTSSLVPHKINLVRQCLKAGIWGDVWVGCVGRWCCKWIDMEARGVEELVGELCERLKREKEKRVLLNGLKALGSRLLLFWSKLVNEIRNDMDGIVNDHQELVPRNVTLSQLGAVFLELFDLLPADTVVPFFGDVEALLLLLRDMLDDSLAVFPCRWIAIGCLVVKGTLKVLKSVGEYLYRITSPLEAGTQEISPVTLQSNWLSFFTTLLHALTHPIVHPESHNPQRRRVLHKLNSDIRGEAGELLRMYSSEMAVVDVELFLRLSCSPHPGLRRVAGDVLGSVLSRTRFHRRLRVSVDSTTSGNDEGNDRSQFLRSFVEGSWKIVSSTSSAGQGWKTFLIDALQSSVAIGPHDPEAVLLIAKLDGLLDHALRLRTTTDDDDEIEALCGLLKYLVAQEWEMATIQSVVVEILENIVAIHEQESNYIEAGIALTSISDLLSWDELSRKEANLRKSLELFEKGLAWEWGINTCKELGSAYEERGMWRKWADVLERQAGFARSMDGGRVGCEYYRVIFYPTNGRDGVGYVYKAGEWEKLGAFCERLGEKGWRVWRGAEKDMPILSKDGRGWVVVTAVSPVMVDYRRTGDREISCDRKWSSRLFGDFTENVDVDLWDVEPDLADDLDSSGRRHLNSRRPTVHFTFSRPIHRPPPAHIFPDIPASDPAHEFLSLWTEKTVLATETPLPSLALRSKIFFSKTFLLSPVQTAVITVQSKNRQLSQMISQFSAHQHDRSVNLSPLTMHLHGTVDSPVNGGVPLYARTFLSEAYRSHPDLTEDELKMVERLREAVEEQKRVLRQGLEVHGRLVGPEMRPLHGELWALFAKNFGESTLHGNPDGGRMSTGRNDDGHEDLSSTAHSYIKSRHSQSSSRTEVSKRASTNTSSTTAHTAHTTFTVDDDIPSVPPLPSNYAISRTNSVSDLSSMAAIGRSDSTTSGMGKKAKTDRDGDGIWDKLKDAVKKA
ncbi:hypothetical protein BC832DRAFT_542549 [Gaertneriomyces semiglobifer]|nr:hypothetical protein BC832DRAFT_542549 [Gaertneriomyces semiglobifer]